MNYMIVVVFGLVAAWSLWATVPAREAELSKMVRELLDAARARYPEDARFRTPTIRDVRPFPPEDLVDHARGTVRRGKFVHSTGIMYVATHRANGRPLDPSIIAGVVVHEVAHAIAGRGHTDMWRSVYESLLRVATEDLNWSVTLECSSCGFYKVCSKAQCPRCVWQACRSVTRA